MVIKDSRLNASGYTSARNFTSLAPVGLAVLIEDYEATLVVVCSLNKTPGSYCSSPCTQLYWVPFAGEGRLDLHGNLQTF